MKSHQMLDIRDRMLLCIFMIRRFSDVRRTTARSICDSMSTKDCLKITCSSGFQNNTTYKSSRGRGQQDMRNHTHEQFLRSKSIFKRLSVSFLNARDRDFGKKLPSNSFFLWYSISVSKWSSKYSHLLFWIFRQQKIEDENGSLECARDIKKLLKSKKYRKCFLCK